MFENTVKTTFNCPIELRDELEQLVNDYTEKYTPDEIMIKLLKKGLEDKSIF